MSVGSTFQVVEPRLIKVKIPKLICAENVQEVGELAIPAPAGVTLDVNTGLLNVAVTVEPTGPPQLRRTTVLDGKVINEGVVPVRLLVAGAVAIQRLEIPFQGVVECPGAIPGDLVQKHDVEIEGFSIAPVQVLAAGGTTLTLDLILKVVLELCVVVARETIMKVTGAELFCP